jgi:hypothetical protein
MSKLKGTLFFIHGTGVRHEGWVTLWGRVQDYARANGIDGVGFVGCEWGPKLGVPVDLVPDTLPKEVSTKAVVEAPPGDAEVAAALWALLLDDPLFELRVASEAAPVVAVGIGGVVLGGVPPGQAAKEMLDGLAGKVAALDLGGLRPEEVAAAAQAMAAAPELQKAAEVAGPADPDFVDAAARAVVARVLASHRQDEPGTPPVLLFDGAKRDDLVQRIAAVLAPATKGFSDWVKEKVVGFAQRKATRAVEDRREGLMGMSTPAIGDILYYQRRGDTIARFVADGLRDLPRPVVAVGHSLGGIMLVDLLSRPDAPPVDLLVTAGSQAPMLYAIDSLERLRRGEAEPKPFTPWLNIYNRQDFLSFCASRVFPGTRQWIRDEEVDPGVPFPESHSAYWYHDRVYQLIRDAWPS